MPAFTAPAAMDALKTALEARNNLSGVTVATAPLGSDTPREAITIDRVDHAEEHASMARVEETYEIQGDIFILKPGKDNAIAKSARDRAFALLREIRDELDEDETITSTVTTARFAGYELRQDVGDPPARIANIEWRCEVRAMASEA